MLAFDVEDTSPAIIKVVGVGGAGMNAIERMVSLNLQGVEMIAMNTDEQVLRRSSAHVKVHLGAKITGGKGAGAKPDIGAQAAMEDRDQILNVLKGADMIFITAGMGGGTGTGASPIVADVAKELNTLTVGVITMPFSAEGAFKKELARKGQASLKEKVDTLITIPNDSVFKMIDRNTSFSMAYKYIDDVLARSVMGISDIINKPGFINVDFADIATVMSQNGDAIIGLGEGYGDNKVSDALQQAIHHPLLEGRSIEGANAVLINVSGGSDFTMHEYHEVQETISAMMAENGKFIVGLVEDSSMEDRVSITVIATGFNSKKSIDISSDDNSDEKKPSSEIEKEIKEPGVMDRMSASSKKSAYQNHTYPAGQQSIMFPNVDTQNYNVPAFLRAKKTTS